MMIKEEMRPTLESLGWEAKEWNRRSEWRAKDDAGFDPVLQEGLRAYALDQADIRTSMETHFRSIWEAPLAETVASGPTTGDLGQDRIEEDDEDEDEDDIGEEGEDGFGEEE